MRAILGYVLAIHEKPKKVITPTTSTLALASTHRTHQKALSGEESSEESSEFTQNEDDETGENGVENLTGGNNQPTGELRIEEVSESRRRKTSPVSEKNLTEDRSTSSKRISRRAQLFQRVAKEVIAALGKPPQPQQLPRREVQFEDVELVGKKVTARSR